jgi:hypothetical protein
MNIRQSKLQYTQRFPECQTSAGSRYQSSPLRFSKEIYGSGSGVQELESDEDVISMPHPDPDPLEMCFF